MGGDTAAALQTYKDVGDKFAKSEYGPQSYFARAGLLFQLKKNDEMFKVLKDYIQKYPDAKDIFQAYDTMGQTQAIDKKYADAIATYNDMVDQHGDNDHAPTALFRVADLYQQEANALGKYIALDDAQRKDWSKDLQSSIDAGEKLIDKYPDSAEVGNGLKIMLDDQKLLLDAKLKTPDQIDSYYHTLAGKYSSSAAAKSRILFALAVFTFPRRIRAAPLPRWGRITMPPMSTLPRTSMSTGRP